MKPGSEASWRVSAALLLFFAFIVLQVGQCYAAQSVVLHLTRAEMLEEAPGPLAPVDEAASEAQIKGVWKPVTLPLVLKNPDNPGPRSTWIRVPVDAPPEMRGPTEFYLVSWLAPGHLAIYGDGHLLHRSPGTPIWNMFTHPAVLFPLSSGNDGVPPRVLLIRLDRVPGQNAALSSIYVGDSASVVAMAERRDFIVNQLPFMMSSGFVLVGIFALGVWLFRRKYPGHLIFVISAMSMVRRWHFQYAPERLPIPDSWFVWLALNALLWQVIASHFLMNFLHGRKHPRLSRGLIAASIAITIVTLPAGRLPLPDLLWARLAAQFLVILIALTIGVVGLWSAWRARAFDAQLLASTYALCFCAGVSDYFSLMYMKNPEGIYMTGNATSLYALTCIFLMFRRYVHVVAEIETVNITLEKRVQAREAELEASYVRLREIEREQTLSNERQRLMQDMHDGLGSSLVSALRVVKSKSESDQELEEVIMGCIDDLKLTIDSLEPVEANLLLLLATLRYRFGPRLKSAGIVLRWDVVEVPRLDWLNPSGSLHILRILQEAFSNILKHTQATGIRVATSADPLWVWVTVEDNGPGFDVARAAQTGGRGLANQQRRATALEGKVDIVSSPAGTQLTLFLPQKRPAGEFPKRSD
jgi:signal transduction histidine kinase